MYDLGSPRPYIADTVATIVEVWREVLARDDVGVDL